MPPAATDPYLILRRQARKLGDVTIEYSACRLIAPTVLYNNPACCCSYPPLNITKLHPKASSLILRSHTSNFYYSRKMKVLTKEEEQAHYK